MDSRNTDQISFKQIFNQICGQLGDTKGISKKFSELKSDEDRFKFTYDICKDFILNLNLKRVNKSYQKFVCLSKVGDCYYSKHEYWEAVKAYNESIAFAGSEHLAAAFLKRSLTLSRLSFPEEADVDCSSAMCVAQSDSLKADIENHKQALSKTGKNSKNKWLIGNGEIHPLNRERSNFFDSASKSVGLLNDDSWGRQLVAEDHIKTGEVLIVEKPHSSVLLPDHLHTHCSHCFKRSLNLQPCSGCSFAMFCNDNCQKKSQNSYHYTECNIIDILVGLKLERMELLSLRILLNASQQGKNLLKLYEETNKVKDIKNNNENDNQFYKSSDFINIYNLVGNTEKRSVADLFYRSVISAVLIHLLERYTTFFAPVEKEENKDLLKVFCGGLLLRFMQSLPCNAHEIPEFCEDGFDEIGAGAYATLSLINHSCDPNVVRHSSGDVIILRAIKPIMKGEQIFDNYGYHYATHSLNDRQSALQKQYYFKCNCEACVRKWPTYEGLPSDNISLKKEINLDIYKKKTEKFQANLKEIFNGNFTSATIEENMMYLDFLHEFVKLPWQDYNKCQEAIKHCLSFTGNHFRCLEHVVISRARKNMYLKSFSLVITVVYDNDPLSKSIQAQVLLYQNFKTSPKHLTQKLLPINPSPGN